MGPLDRSMRQSSATIRSSAEPILPGDFKLPALPPDDLVQGFAFDRRN